MTLHNRPKDEPLDAATELRCYLYRGHAHYHAGRYSRALCGGAEPVELCGLPVVALVPRDEGGGYVTEPSGAAVFRSFEDLRRLYDRHEMELDAEVV